MSSGSPFNEFVNTVGRQPLSLVLDVADRAASFGSERWGLTYWDGDAVRVNVGWTEIVTVSREGIRLIVDERLARASGAKVHFQRRAKPRGFYQTIPGSVLVQVEWVAGKSQGKLLSQLRPALDRSVELAGRWPASRGVRAGHNPWAVNELARVLGRRAPKAGYSARLHTEPSPSSRVISLMEGALKRVVSNRYERRPALRRACIERYGAVCVVCGYSFEREFGDIGRGFIHVHHLEPLAGRRPRKNNSIIDLRPICPNCHAMIHRQNPPLPIDELKDLRRRPKRRR